MLVWHSSLQIVRLIKQCVVSNGSHNGSRATLSPSCSCPRNITFTYVPERQSKWTQIGRCSWESIARCNDVPRGNNLEFGLVIVCTLNNCIDQLRGCSWIIIYKFARRSYHLQKLETGYIYCNFVSWFNNLRYVYVFLFKKLKNI